MANDKFSNIEKLGFDEWFQNKMEPSSEDFRVTRVTSVNKSNYTVTDGLKEIKAELTGKFLYESESSLDYPAVGDWVYSRLYDEDTLAIIFDLFPRKSLLKRKTPGNKIEYQLIGANIDTALIVQALDGNYNLRRLERYLVMINEGNIEPYVLLSKSDLLSSEEIENKKNEILSIFPQAKVLAFSNKNDEDINTLKDLLTPGKTFCLIGSSGVGKTTLLNNLINEELFSTQEIREKDGRGKHTTTRRQLVVLSNGAIIIDTPGMRELGVISAEHGLDETFSEITELTEECKFKDCTHTVEKGCAVLAALKDGDISEERYNNYMKMHKESAYHEMSYLEKRQKDKSFGKMVKSIMKNKKDKY